ncbi:DinB family protein [Larkinella sp. VNQ87]|uniref:DinB family protein n=1 Tax=Larkinella sp. VNQ87 TaxID=3400921 RepID=UPI003C11E5FB
MSPTTVDPRKFPIGPLSLQDTYSSDELAHNIAILVEAPSQYRQLVENRSADELAKTYREGSWTVQQLIHHVADIHLLHYFRMKKALTEPDYDTPTLINMDGWAATPDATLAPIEDSLQMFETINLRYLFLIRSLDEAQLAKAYFHPVRKIRIDQAQAVAMSVWHVQHHLAHIKLALGLP